MSAGREHDVRPRGTRVRRFGAVLGGAVIATTVCLAACTSGGSAGGDGSPLTSLARRADEIAGRGDLVLDVAHDGALITARELATGQGVDGARALEVTVSTSEGVMVERFAEPLADARFVPGSRAVIALTSKGVLLAATSTGAPLEGVDARVVGPISAAGGRVAYARGEAPELEIVTWRPGEAPRALTSGYAPAWSPALSTDGQAVAFVSAKTGWPGVYVAEGGGIRRVSGGEKGRKVPFPASAWAPRWSRGVLVFDDREGTHAIEVASGRLLWTRTGAHAPIEVSTGAWLLRGEAGFEVSKGGAR